MQEQEKQQVKASPVEAVVIRDYRNIADKFTEIVARQTHYFEIAGRIDMNTTTAEHLTELSEGWLIRYRNDAIFHAKVDSLVSELIRVVTDV